MYTRTHSWQDNLIIVKNTLLPDLGSTFCCIPETLLTHCLGFHLLKSISDLWNSWEYRWAVGIHYATTVFFFFLTIFMGITYIFKAISYSSYLSFIAEPCTFRISTTSKFRHRAKHSTGFRALGEGFPSAQRRPHLQIIDLAQWGDCSVELSVSHCWLLASGTRCSALQLCISELWKSSSPSVQLRQSFAM